MNKKIEKHQFQSEIKQLLHLMIHSLYSNKEIFLRELISNASDAIDKLRFNLLLSKNEIKKKEKEYIRIILNKSKNTITISDNGIGMNKIEIIENLGTIARSGTKKFLKNLSPDQIKNNQLIGKFGVGFYSAFMVAKEITVKTRHMQENNPDNSIFWRSNGSEEYLINTIYKEEHGTEVEILLKDNEKEFLEEWKIRNIINKYSDHITIPIEIQEYNTKNKTFSWKQINKAKALWTFQKSQITKKEYKDFYYDITKDTNGPLAWTHNHIEGTQPYINLLYIPKKSSWNIWEQDNKNNGIKLYIKKTYIMDDASCFLPNYLRFIKGILDAENLPLNISREILQENSITKKIKLSLTKRVLNLLHILSNKKEKKYQIFWKEFGTIFKEGIAEDTTNREKIANLLRFTSMKNNSHESILSLNEYIKNMHENQEKIYFLIAENYESAKTSPHLEIFQKNNIDVLLLSNRIDEWMMNYLTEFKNKKFQSINKIDNEFEKKFKKNNKNYNENPEIKNFLENIQNTLKEKVEKVTISDRLIHSPAALIANKNTLSPHMAKLFTAAGQKVPPVKYILEINIDHDLIKKIMNIQDKHNFKNWINLLFDQSLLSEQGSLDNPNHFIKNMNKLLINNENIK
ncbi:molecular chaperone HtpG [Buchnera aphidicola]|uniref:molecular chaperone HtpG n=1 Tax=Buchnera aphidicola TaxID=9 RepID=UPI0031B84E38